MTIVVRRFAFLSLSTIIIIFLSSLPLVFAGAGNLDPGFGAGGKVVTDFLGSRNEQGEAIAVQSDGKIVVAGFLTGIQGRDFLVARYNTNGTFDTSFGVNGVVTTDFGGSGDDRAFAVAIQSDGKIVAAGRANLNAGNMRDFGLARYNTDGTLDTSFGVGGLVTTDFGNGENDQVNALAIQTDGKIVAAGLAFNGGDNDFAIARYNVNGIPDTTFNSTGMLTADLGGNDRIFAVKIQTDGQIVVAGESGGDFSLARYGPTGIPDSSFGASGYVFTDFSGSTDSAQALAIQADGKLVVAGSTDAGGGGNNFALARYNSDGSLDTTFDLDGRVVTDFATANDEAYSVGIQSDGYIVASGSASLYGDNDFAIARYTPTGSLDPAFNTTGKVTTDFNWNTDEAYGMVVQSTGKIVLAGLSGTSLVTGDDLALARYNSNGSLDTTFGAAGKVVTDIPGPDADLGRALARQNDGKLIVAGRTTTAGSQNFAVARYNTDGSLDTSFGGTGVVTTDIWYRDDAARAVAIQSDGKIVVAGVSGLSGINDFAVVRYNSNGSLDTNFGWGGIVTTDFATGDDQAFALAIQSDGKIVVGGFATVTNDEDFALARYNNDGSLDTLFGVNGVVTTDLANDDEIHALAIQPDDMILAGGSSRNSDNNFAIARYTSSGTLDPTFASGGILIHDFGYDEAIFSVALQPDLKIVAAGYTDVFGNGQLEFAVARYTSTGLPDTTFTSLGRVFTDIPGGTGDTAYAVMIQPDGSIVAAGANGNDFALARFLTDGTLDSNFGAGGIATTDFAADVDTGYSSLIQPDGKIVLAGQATNPGNNADFALARYIGICPAFTFSPDALAMGNVGFPYSQTVTAGGGAAPVTYAVTGGNLPNGLSLDPASGLISGTPTAQGTWNFTITATDANSCTGSYDYSIMISPCSPITLSPATLPNVNLGNAYNQTVTAAGGTPPYTYDVSSGSLPPGLTLDPNTGAITGTANTVGTYNFTIAAADSSGNNCQGSQNYTINVTTCTFSDEFNDNTISPDWIIVKPNWSESADSLIGAPTGRKAIITVDPAVVSCGTGCTVRTSMQTAGGDYSSISTVGWYVTKRDSVELMLKLPDKWILKQRVGGYIVAKGKGLLTINTGVSYDVQMAFDGTTFTVTVNGNPLITLPKGAGSSPAGTVGYYVKSTTGTFGSICVQ